jgi:uncharacterized protein
MQITHRNEDGSPRYTNHLAAQTSPYLLKHAHNPVEWYPWGEEAFARARRENRPIHLSIGYYACHWCSVLEEESFEDEATAKVLNDLFVNIKVDREERPDVDRIYQIAQQMLTQRGGGWPLTMMLAPHDHRPFFGGTYFPKEARYGLPAFKDLLLRVAEYYRDHGAELAAQNAALMEAFAELDAAPAGAVDFTDAPLTLLRQQVERVFDPRDGGFGGAPKFPQPQVIVRLLRDWRASAASPQPDLHALYMATLTLRRMAEGGINDQLDGGFCRYAVDATWTVPHFEKMLYDNAALLALYAQAAVATGDTEYARIALATADWVLREMQSAQGGYYSSLDADSEGHEGKFYVFDREEVRAELTAEEFAAFAAYYGMDEPANFEGRWHLYTARDAATLAPQLGAGVQQIEGWLGAAREKVRALRAMRVRPARDEKILTSWNALMIRGMAIAARALGREDLADSASRALGFIRGTLWRDGRLLATCMSGKAYLNAYLDDYVYLIDALLELQQVRVRTDEIALAQQLAEVVMAHFEDQAGGGFYFTSDDHEALIHRLKPFADEAIPAGNGIAACVLLRLGHLLAEPRYLAAAERVLAAAWPALSQHPQGHATLLTALEELLHPPQIVLIRGEQEAATLWALELARLYAPRRMVLALGPDCGALPPALDKPARAGTTLAYVCRGGTCSAPLQSLGALINELRAS